ncbi:MAG: DUF2802 domain-containing protein [Proteobacteria bacterium]|nr:DUF2802 domain-containing protein [Pseudomonadota bacterium]RTL31948.1 MAG: DUF2802 domain-containing protein [Rhodocyclaceae bacterium]
MTGIGVREAVLALVAVLSLYLVVVLFRLARHRRGTPPPETPEPAVKAETPVGRAPVVVPEPAPDEAEVSRELLNELEIQQLRQDMTRLRADCDFLRRELAVMRHDVDQLGEQARSEQQAAQTARERTQYTRPVSPQHSEAMLLAGRGMSAAQVAEHCGISVAEAELVCALAKAESGS